MKKEDFLRHIRETYKDDATFEACVGSLVPKKRKAFRFNTFFLDGEWTKMEAGDGVSERTAKARVEAAGKWGDILEKKDADPWEKAGLLAARLKEELGVGMRPLKGFEKVGAFVLSAEDADAINRTSLGSAGAIYFQNPASMMGAMALAPNPEDEILDLAAAPGGKTHLLAVMMGNKGRIAANEIDKNRFFRMRENLSTLGVANADFYMHDGALVGGKTPERFDKVLLDSPCSSDSLVMPDYPETLDPWDSKKSKKLARLQKRLIASAYDALKPGGRMVYSTCAFGREENEEVVAELLKTREGAKLIDPGIRSEWEDEFMILPGFTELPQGKVNKYAKNDAPAPVMEELALCRRVVPGDLANGFFLALIEKPA